MKYCHYLLQLYLPFSRRLQQNSVFERCPSFQKFFEKQIDCLLFRSLSLFISQQHHKTTNKLRMRQVPTVTESEIKVLSLPLIGSVHPNFRQIDHERFKAKFGLPVDLCVLTWNRIVQQMRENDISIKGYSLKPVHILYALFFMRCYPTARQTIATLGHDMSLLTFRKYAYFVVRQIAALSDEVVS